jgi:hypothetical protein
MAVSERNPFFRVHFCYSFTFCFLHSHIWPHDVTAQKQCLSFHQCFPNYGSRRTDEQWCSAACTDMFYSKTSLPSLLSNVENVMLRARKFPTSHYFSQSLDFSRICFLSLDKITCIIIIIITITTTTTATVMYIIICCI